MKSLVFAQNYKRYRTGNYHMDLLNAIRKQTEAYVYGPGFPEYNINDDYETVLRKMNISEDDIDVIIVSTNWENETSETESDLHPNICLADVNEGVKKIFFLNKEYKKIEKKIEYILKNKFDLVVTVLPEKLYVQWQNATGIQFMQSHFGINTNEFKNYKLERKYDFTFTGSLHEAYTDKRILVKKHLFKKPNVKASLGLPRVFSVSNPIKKEYQSYKIYWAEWGKLSTDLRGKSLLPSGREYVKLMNMSKVFFSTLSADGIFGTRFFEIMASGAVLFCPEDDYYGLLEDGYNCVMYKNDMSNFDERLREVLINERMRAKIVENAAIFCEKQNYEERLKNIFKQI